MVREVIDEYCREVDQGIQPPLPDRAETARNLTDKTAGLGPLQRFMDDPSIEEIWINTPSRVFVARAGRPELTNVALTDQEVRDLAERMLRVSGRRLDLSSPFVDATLAGGERLHVVIPPITQRHWSINIRKYVAKAWRTADLVALGALTPVAAHFLDACVVAGLNILVSGATQAGKTTLVRALAGAIPGSARVITVEEVFELALTNRDVVAMQSRQANYEGAGKVDLRRLVKEALRMRPDRLIIGEVREAESFDMLIGLNAGVPGACTIHANSAREAITKMCTLPLLAGENVSSSFVVPTVANAIDIVVHLGMNPDGTREVREILGVSGRTEAGVIETAEIFVRQDGALVRGSGFPPAREKFERVGLDPALILNGDGTPHRAGGSWRGQAGKSFVSSVVQALSPAGPCASEAAPVGGSAGTVTGGASVPAVAPRTDADRFADAAYAQALGPRSGWEGSGPWA